MGRINTIPVMTGNAAPSGSATSSTKINSTTEAYMAFCNVGSGWLAGTSTGWLQYEFDIPTRISQYSIIPWSADNFPGRSPKTWTLQGSNNGVDYDVLDTQTDYVDWVQNTPSYFVLSTSHTYKYWKINITLNGGDSYTGMKNLSLYTEVSNYISTRRDRLEIRSVSKKSIIRSANVNIIPNMTSNTDPSGVCDGSSYYYTVPYYCAFRDADPGWITNGTSTGYIQYQFPSAVCAGRYSIIPWSADNFPDRSPKTWTLQGSNNGVDYDVLDTQTDYTNWIVSAEHIFDLYPTPAAYSYFKLNVTANGGNGYMGIRRLMIYARYPSDYLHSRRDRLNMKPVSANNNLA